MRTADAVLGSARGMAFAGALGAAVVAGGVAVGLWLMHTPTASGHDPAAPASTLAPLKILPPQRMVAPPEKNVLVVPEPRLILQPQWIERPTGREFERYYPAEALAKEIKARVVLDCLVMRTGRLDCIVVEETPKGYGFGAAAINIAKSFQIAPQTIDGKPTAGGKVRVPIMFNIGR